MALFSKSRIPSFVKWFYPSYYLWDQKIKGQKTIYLTFDDGPIPEVTEFVLDTLLQIPIAIGSKQIAPSVSTPAIPATFFCIGDNVRKHPKLFQRIIAEGHSVGNHTFNHLKGTVTDNNTYLKNTHLAELEMAKHLNQKPDALSTQLFRPPYGRIKRKQAKALKALDYKIVMYRVIAFDWEASLSPEQCLKNVVSTVRDGDIIVFHDSVKAFENLTYALPKTIDYLIDHGFTFGRL